MKIKEIMSVLDAELLTPGANLEKEVFSACGSDMMSDVLAFVKNQAVLVTGLNNPQVVRTADMMDMSCIVFVRGKSPQEQIIQMASEMDMVILSTSKTMFSTCGILYEHGLRGGEKSQ